MRLWSLHPTYLDKAGIGALWREGLLAQAVLAGLTNGYTNHPQLERFKGTRQAVDAVGAYLCWIFLDAKNRGYEYNSMKILSADFRRKIPVTYGQVAYEQWWLWANLQGRDRRAACRLAATPTRELLLNPVFARVAGGIEPWEKPQ